MREGPGKVASVVARAAASREVTVVIPASGAKHPGEGRGREWEEQGPSGGSWHPGQEGLGTLLSGHLDLPQANLVPWGKGG